jgi:hypothetical protein
MTIYKYPLKITGTQQIELPINAVLLTVQMQGETLCLWAKVEERNTVDDRTIEIFGTGHPIDNYARSYIGTVQEECGADGVLVWHVFERL